MMNKTVGVVILLMTLSTIRMNAQNSLEIIVKNVRNDKGHVLVALSNNEKTFLKEVWRGEKAKAVVPEVKVVFNDLPAGEYGLSVIHDENDNGELDTNSIGIPKEGFGFGNDAMGMFGPPSFKKASVRVYEGVRTEVVTLKHF